MKYIAIIDADEKPVSCEFIGCNGNTTPYLIGGTTNIKALEQEPCENAISRQAVLEIVRDMHGLARADVLSSTINQIEKLSPVAPKAKTGHWEQYGYSWEDKFKCSECGEKQPKILCGERIIGHWSDYCPNCGADMRG